jgi:hypothetical protein
MEELMKYPQYTYVSERMKSFDGVWPRFFHMKAEDLAQGGFIFGGRCDVVTCFWCGITIQDWRVKDEVWIEHRRFSPSCGYVKMAGPIPTVDKTSSNTTTSIKMQTAGGFTFTPSPSFAESSSSTTTFGKMRTAGGFRLTGPSIFGRGPVNFVGSNTSIPPPPRENCGVLF